MEYKSKWHHVGLSLFNSWVEFNITYIVKLQKVMQNKILI